MTFELDLQGLVRLRESVLVCLEKQQQSTADLAEVGAEEEPAVAEEEPANEKETLTDTEEAEGTTESEGGSASQGEGGSGAAEEKEQADETKGQGDSPDSADADGEDGADKVEDAAPAPAPAPLPPVAPAVIRRQTTVLPAQPVSLADGDADGKGYVVTGLAPSRYSMYIYTAWFAFLHRKSLFEHVTVFFGCFFF